MEAQIARLDHTIFRLEVSVNHFDGRLVVQIVHT